MQNNKKMIIGVVAAVVIIALGTTYYLSTKDNVSNSAANEPVNQGQNQGQNSGQNQNNPVLPAGTQTIEAQHSFQNGKHMVAGLVTVPTPCDALDVKTRIMESSPEQVELAFTTSNSGGMCIQVLAGRKFKVDFQASQNATIRASMNGKPVNLKLTPASQKTLEAFEVDIKG